jgi:hypothetical protein
MSDELKQRVREANKVIAIVAKHGRRFFYSREYDRTARFGLDRHEQVWYLDEHTGMKLYPFDVLKDWKGFTHGSTLKCFVADLSEYITTGKRLLRSAFPIENDGSLWAYGGDVMRQVLEEVLAETKAVQP